jgi:hypothetical protein
MPGRGPLPLAMIPAGKNSFRLRVVPPAPQSKGKVTAHSVA